jgi:hypothetical protein
MLEGFKSVEKKQESVLKEYKLESTSRQKNHVYSSYLVFFGGELESISSTFFARLFRTKAFFLVRFWL